MARPGADVPHDRAEQELHEDGAGRDQRRAPRTPGDVVGAAAAAASHSREVA